MNKKEKAEQSRRLILESALREIHCKGFQAASIKTILADTGLTKGAFYHHFPDKQALGYAVVEMIRSEIKNIWVDPLENTTDPLTTLQNILDATSKTTTVEVVKLGCPLNNLAQELSSENGEFRNRIAEIYDFWRKSIADALRRGQKAGYVDRAVDPLSTATFFVASLNGIKGLSKAVQNLEVLMTCFDHLGRYLENLRS